MWPDLAAKHRSPIQMTANVADAVMLWHGRPFRMGTVNCCAGLIIAMAVGRASHAGVVVATLGTPGISALGFTAYC